MAQFMAPYERHTYAALRIVAGGMLLFHGAQKLFGFPSAAPDGLPAFVIYVGGSIEFFGGILVAIGLFTRWAAFLCSGLMAAAYWMVHGTKALLPFVNGGEPAALYCFVFLFIAAAGPGMWSADQARA
jgi:putative oxidoreductase